MTKVKFQFITHSVNNSNCKDIEFLNTKNLEVFRIFINLIKFFSLYYKSVYTIIEGPVGKRRLGLGIFSGEDSPSLVRHLIDLVVTFILWGE